MINSVYGKKKWKSINVRLVNNEKKCLNSSTTSTLTCIAHKRFDKNYAAILVKLVLTLNKPIYGRFALP